MGENKTESKWSTTATLASQGYPDVWVPDLGRAGLVETIFRGPPQAVSGRLPEWNSWNSRPSKPNQRKGQNKKFVEKITLFVNSGAIHEAYKGVSHLKKYGSRNARRKENFIETDTFCKNRVVCKGHSLRQFAGNFPRGFAGPKCAKVTPEIRSA